MTGNKCQQLTDHWIFRLAVGAGRQSSKDLERGDPAGLRFAVQYLYLVICKQNRVRCVGCYNFVFIVNEQLLNDAFKIFVNNMRYLNIVIVSFYCVLNTSWGNYVLVSSVVLSTCQPGIIRILAWKGKSCQQCKVFYNRLAAHMMLMCKL